MRGLPLRGEPTASLNSTTSIFVKDFYEPYIVRSETDSRKGLRVARICSMALGVLGMVIVQPSVLGVAASGLILLLGVLITR